MCLSLERSFSTSRLGPIYVDDVVQHGDVQFLWKKMLPGPNLCKNRMPHHIRTYIEIPGLMVTFPWYNGKIQHLHIGQGNPGI